MPAFAEANVLNRSNGVSEYEWHIAPSDERYHPRAEYEYHRMYEETYGQKMACVRSQCEMRCNCYTLLRRLRPQAGPDTTVRPSSSSAPNTTAPSPHRQVYCPESAPPSPPEEEYIDLYPELEACLCALDEGQVRTHNTDAFSTLAKRGGLDGFPGAADALYAAINFREFPEQYTRLPSVSEAHNVDERTFKHALALVDYLYARHFKINFDSCSADQFTVLMSETCGTPSAHLTDLSADEGNQTTHLHIDSCGGAHVFRDKAFILDPSAHVPTNVRMSTGTGQSETCHSYGPFAIEVQDRDGNWFPVVRNGFFLPTFKANIFSVNRDRRLDGAAIIPSQDVSSISAHNNDTLIIDGRDVSVSNAKDISRVAIRPVSGYDQSLSTALWTELSPDVELMHRRLGHMPLAAMAKLPQHTVGCDIHVPAKAIAEHRRTPVKRVSALA